MKIGSGQGEQLRWHCEKPGEAPGDVAASVVTEAPGSTGSGREIEARHHVAGSEPLNKGQEKSMVRLLPQKQWTPQHSGDPSAMEQPPKTAGAVEWSRPEPVRCSVCVLCARAREVELPMSPEAQSIFSSNSGQTLSCVFTVFLRLTLL